MYCPKCSQEQLAENIRFCSRCGFLLTGIAEIIENDGIIPNTKQTKKTLIPKKKGMKQGFFMLVLAILLSPILMIIAVEMEIRPGAFILTMFILVTIAIVRMIYAKMFETEDFETETNSFQQNTLPNQKTAQSLPPLQTQSVTDFVPPMQGNWRDTNDLVYSSVTDETTRKLKD